MGMLDPEIIGREHVLSRLVERYLELCEVCYRVAVSRHDERGRFRRGHPGRRVHPALLKKVDLDRALAHVYRRFFLAHEEDAASSTSTSNSRPQGSETITSSAQAASAAPSNRR